MEWDLYLDESGAFQTDGAHTLIGGFLLPHDEGSREALFDRWCKEIRSDIISSGIYSEEELRRGDEIHRKNSKTSSNSGERFYVFGHCRETPSSASRWKAQRLVLDRFTKKIEAAGGRIVVFDNPDGIYRIDSNTTFMTVFANGFMKLYNALKASSGEGTVININAASRKNITRAKEGDRIGISPLGGNGPVLDKGLYLNQIRNLIFLHGGHSLLGLHSFESSLRSFRIIDDIKNAKGEKRPHPATFICDYICNSLYVSHDHTEFRSYFEKEKAYIFDVFEEKVIWADFDTEYKEQNHEWGAMLIDLISSDFPVERTHEFFDRLNASGYDQSLCVKAVVDHLYSFVQIRDSIDEMIDRIRKTIEKCRPMHANAYAELKANMLIFLSALYTHKGDSDAVTEAEIDFKSSITDIREIAKRDELITLFLNRQIVSYTDLFEYQRAEKCFRILKAFRKKQSEVSDDLLLDFAEISSLEAMPESICTQLGRSTGSYIQLKTKQIRLKGLNDDIALDSDTIAEGLNCFEDPADISRYHQNMSDYYTETGEYDKAMGHLCLSLNIEYSKNFEDSAGKILDITGNYGEKASIFAYLHYVYMMHRCIRTGDRRGKAMLALILRETPSADRLEHLKTDEHPQCVILWHLAACLATEEKYRPLSKELFDLSYELTGNDRSKGSIFGIIALGVKAEQTACGLSSMQPGKEEKWVEEATRTDAKLIKYTGCAAFEDILHNVLARFEHTDDPQRYYAVADSIPY